MNFKSISTFQIIFIKKKYIIHEKGKRETNIDYQVKYDQLWLHDSAKRKPTTGRRVIHKGRKLESKSFPCDV